MRHGIFKKATIVAHLIITLSLFGEIGDHAALYDTYKYVSVEKVNVETIIKYVDMFIAEYYSALERSMNPRNGSYIKSFIHHYYFQKGYKLENSMTILIEIHYEKPIFSFCQQHYINIKFYFRYFPPYEKDIMEWPGYNLLVKDFMDQFDNYISKNDIILTGYPLEEENI
jgi:hypothetical protein